MDERGLIRHGRRLRSTGVGRSRAARRALRENNEGRCRRILELAAPLELDDLDWGSVGQVELDASMINTLVYMRDVEGFTDRELVGLMAHRSTHADPLVARFLEVWQAEERMHCGAVERYLHAYEAVRPLDLPPRQPPPPSVAPLRERILAQIGGPVGRVVTTAHMAWGAANEMLTMHGYRLLAERCGDPVLAELLTRIAAQEARHYSFYLLQAEWRLAASPLARWVLPKVLDGTWTPVGIGDGYKSREEFEAVLAYLCEGAEGRAAISRMDRRFSSLPGFERLRIFGETAAGVLNPAT